eukprot:4417885-Prymnesium_polylepis.1
MPARRRQTVAGAACCSDEGPVGLRSMCGARTARLKSAPRQGPDVKRGSLLWPWTPSSGSGSSAAACMSHRRICMRLGLWVLQGGPMSARIGCAAPR